MSLGQLGSARRRFFYGPGINNFEMTLTKVTRITESKSLEFQLEGFKCSITRSSTAREPSTAM